MVGNTEQNAEQPGSPIAVDLTALQLSVALSQLRLCYNLVRKEKAARRRPSK